MATDCSALTILFDQRRQIAFYNIPPPRYTPVSPYPDYTQEQLNMRRKVEILKYQNNQSGSKTNNLTKKQLYAQLANTRANNQQIQQTIQQQQQINTCLNETKPTWTTACGVPGRPTLLTYDPTVPLYNYINQSILNSSYSVLPDPNTSVLHLFSQNEIQYLYETSATISQDLSNVDIIPNQNYQTRTLNIGSIVNTKFMAPEIFTYSLSIPVGVWFVAYKGLGIINSNICDPNGETFTNDPLYGILNFDPSCYVKFPTPFPETTPLTFHIDYTIHQPVLSVTYSGKKITPFATPIIHSNIDANIVRFQDVSFVPFQAGHQMFGIQYVGNLVIENLQLQVQSESVYNLSITMNYYYNADLFEKFDLIKSGLFLNLTSANMNVADGFQFSSIPPTYVQTVLASGRLGDFVAFNSDPIISVTTPLIQTATISKYGVNFVFISNITGQYDSFTIQRYLVSPTTNATSLDQEIVLLTGSTFLDNNLQPNTKYQYQIIPVLNHMNGSNSVVGVVTTNPISITATVGTLSLTSFQITNIQGAFTYYDVSRTDMNVPNSNVVDVNKMSSTYTDNTLLPGHTYSFALIPNVLVGSRMISGPPYTIANITTYNCYVTSARFLPSTTKTVTIQHITGLFDFMTILRKGIPPKSFPDIASASTFVDNDTTILSGNSYLYSIIPSVRTHDGTGIIDGSEYIVGTTTIP